MNLFIVGGGNLGQAIAIGVAAADKAVEITVSRRNVAKIEQLKKHGICITTDNKSPVNNANIVLIAVKPHQMNEVLEEIKPYIKKQIVVSVATGYSIDSIKKILGENTTIFRAMPNSAIVIRESMTCIANANATPEQIALVENLFSKLGEVITIDEKMVDASTVLGACGVAFALRYIRAAMQGGIQIGFDSETALKITSQTARGAASLLLNGNTHPESEIDKVTTPQGCTIAGLNEMEFQGFSSSLIKGIITSYEEIDNIRKS